LDTFDDTRGSQKVLLCETGRETVFHSRFENQEEEQAQVVCVRFVECGTCRSFSHFPVQFWKGQSNIMSKKKIHANNESALQMRAAEVSKVGIMSNLSRQSNDGDDEHLTSSSMPVVDAELGLSHQHNMEIRDQYSDDDSKQTGIPHKTIFSRRKARALCIGVSLLVLLFVLVELSFTSQSGAGIDIDCDIYLSAPYSSNRNVSFNYCVTHQAITWQNPDVSQFLLPAEQSSQSPLRFLVFGDFGRDGFCMSR